MIGGIVEVNTTRYKRGEENASTMAVYARAISEQNTNSADVSRLKKNLIRAIQEDVTPRQRQVLLLYYAQGLNTREIGEMLGLHPTTISRTIQRGEKRLKRVLRYGAASLLEEID